VTNLVAFPRYLPACLAPAPVKYSTPMDFPLFLLDNTWFPVELALLPLALISLGTASAVPAMLFGLIFVAVYATSVMGWRKRGSSQLAVDLLSTAAVAHRAGLGRAQAVKMLDELAGHVADTAPATSPGKPWFLDDLGEFRGVVAPALEQWGTTDAVSLYLHAASCFLAASCASRRFTLSRFGGGGPGVAVLLVLLPGVFATQVSVLPMARSAQCASIYAGLNFALLILWGLGLKWQHTLLKRMYFGSPQVQGVLKSTLDALWEPSRPLRSTTRAAPADFEQARSSIQGVAAAFAHDCASAGAWYRTAAALTRVAMIFLCVVAPLAVLGYLLARAAGR
jgi:hypothetical protein